jgi:hypothetical protein
VCAQASPSFRAFDEDRVRQNGPGRTPGESPNRTGQVRRQGRRHVLPLGPRQGKSARSYVVDKFSWHNTRFDLKHPYCEGG